MTDGQGSFRKQWLLPIVVLTAAALVIFWGFYTLDYFVTGGDTQAHPVTPIGRYVHFDPTSITDATSSLAGMIAAVFGIVITVVSIIVQLSADRYTGVARMFLRDRINLAVMGYYLIACVCGVWLSVSLHRDYVPRMALLAMIGATTFGLVLMAPYFRYVFWFLEPMNIISRIRSEAVGVAGRGAEERDRERSAAAQAETLSAMHGRAD